MNGGEGPQSGDYLKFPTSSDSSDRSGSAAERVPRRGNRGFASFSTGSGTIEASDSSPLSSPSERMAPAGRDIVDTQWDIPFIDFATVERGVSADSRKNARSHRAAAGHSFFSEDTVAVDAATTQGTDESSVSRPTKSATEDFWSLFEETPDSTADGLTTHISFDRSSVSSGSDMRGEGPHVTFVGRKPTPSEDDGTSIILPPSPPVQGSATTIRPATGRILHASASSARYRANHGTRNRIIIVVLVIIAILALAVSGIVWGINRHQSMAHDTAYERCASSLQRYGTQAASLRTALSSASAATAVTSAQVEDSSTVKRLAKVVSSAKALQSGRTCSASMSTTALSSAATVNIADAERAKKLAVSVENSSEAVLKSQEAKTAADEKTKTAKAKDELSSAISSGETLLANSSGKVADESTRTALETELSNAESVLSDDGSDAAAYSSSTAAVKSAMDAVTQSMQTLAEENAAQTSASPSATGGSDSESLGSGTTGAGTESSSETGSLQTGSSS